MSRVIATANTPSLKASRRPVSLSSFIVSIPGSIHGKMIDDNDRINRRIPGKIIRGYRISMAAYRGLFLQIQDTLYKHPTSSIKGNEATAALIINCRRVE